MSILKLCILASVLGCCLGYAIVRPSAQYYDHQNQPYVYQWPPSFSPDIYQYYYPNYYYYPHQQPSQTEVQFNLDNCPPDEAQKLLQVYCLIRVVVRFRTPPAIPHKITSLDQLVERLTKEPLQEQLHQLVSHLDGYNGVAELERGSTGHEMFVDDIARLLVAIQRALNVLNLDDHDRDLHRIFYPERTSCCEYNGELCGDLRQLRDLANALTVAQIENELVHGIGAEMKQVSDSDGLEDLNTEQESRSLEPSGSDMNVPAIQDNKEIKRPWIPDDQTSLDAWTKALEIYLQQHKLERQEKERQEEARQHITSTTTTPLSSTTEAESWFGDLFGKGDSWVDNQSNTEVDQPAVQVRPTTDQSEQNVEDFDIDERFQVESTTSTSDTVSTVTHTAPLWLIESSEKPVNKDFESDILPRQLEERELPENRQEAQSPKNSNDTLPYTNNSTTSIPEVHDDVAARQLIDDEETEQRSIQEEENTDDRKESVPESTPSVDTVDNTEEIAEKLEDTTSQSHPVNPTESALQE